MNYFNNLNFDNIANDFMNFTSFQDLKSLMRLIRTQREVIVYSVGKIGNAFLDFLQYSNNLKYVCCIATKETNNNNTEQKFSHFLPIIPLEMLVHFKETGLFVVVAPPERHDEIRQNLAEFDFRRILFLDRQILDEVNRELKNFNDSGQIMDWFRQSVISKLGEIEYRIAEQREVVLINTETFKNYKNCFSGKNIVIVGNGPTLSKYNPIRDSIHIGVNRAFFREDFPLDYLFAVENKPDVPEGFKKVDKKIFLGKYLDRLPAHWRNFSEEYSSQDKISRFFLNACARYKDQPIYTDICNHGLVDFGTIVSATLQFALYTSPKTIYLVGCDTTSAGHFYDEEAEEESEGILHTHITKVGYARLKMFARLYYPKTEIISINPVGLKGLFTDVYTD